MAKPPPFLPRPPMDYINMRILVQDNHRTTRGGDARTRFDEITLATCRRHELCCKLYIDEHDINVKACEAGPKATGRSNVQT